MCSYKHQKSFIGKKCLGFCTDKLLHFSQTLNDYRTFKPEIQARNTSLSITTVYFLIKAYIFLALPDVLEYLSDLYCLWPVGHERKLYRLVEYSKLFDVIFNLAFHTCCQHHSSSLYKLG